MYEVNALPLSRCRAILLAPHWSNLLPYTATRWSDMTGRDQVGFDERELLNSGDGVMPRRTAWSDRRGEPSQLGRCDAFVFTETSLSH